MTGQGTHWNRAGRRSGGNPPARFVIGAPKGGNWTGPILSLPCYERRHSDCDGHLFGWAQGRCACKCHEEARK